MQIDETTSREVAKIAAELRRLAIAIAKLRAVDGNLHNAAVLRVKSPRSGEPYANDIWITEDIATALSAALEAEAELCHSALVRLLTAGDDDPIE